MLANERDSYISNQYQNLFVIEDDFSVKPDEITRMFSGSFTQITTTDQANQFAC
jgi:hypothetical protein